MPTERTRVTSESSAPAYAKLYTNASLGTCSNPSALGPDTLYSNESYLAHEKTRTMTDYVTPDFKKQSAKGFVVNNPLTILETEFFREPISWEENRILWRWTNCSGTQVKVCYAGGRAHGERLGLLGTSFLPEPTLSPSIDTMRDLSLTNAYAKANEAEIDSLASVGELGETVRSLRDITYRAVKLVRKLRKGDLAYVWKELTPKQLADRWMEGRYAIRPLVYDMVSVHSALTRKRTYDVVRKTYRSSRSASAEVSQNNIALYTLTEGGYTIWTLFGSKQTRVEVSVRSGLLAALAEISEATIWGLNRPFESIWELVPMSFVMDWFFNVGQTISAWSPKPGMKTLASWTTVTKTVTQSIQTNGVTMGNWEAAKAPYVWVNNCTASGGKITKVTRTVNRYVEPQLSIVPQFELKLNPGKLLDLAIMGKKMIF